MQELFLAGSETTSSTIEWALTELLCNPESLTKAKAELAQVIGPKRKVEESDIDTLEKSIHEKEKEIRKLETK